MRKRRSFDSRVNLKEKDMIQYQYLLNKKLFAHTYRGAKKYTYENGEWTISRAQAGRYMKEVDKWDQNTLMVFNLLHM